MLSNESKRNVNAGQAENLPTTWWEPSVLREVVGRLRAEVVQTHHLEVVEERILRREDLEAC